LNGPLNRVRGRAAAALALALAVLLAAAPAEARRHRRAAAAAAHDDTVIVLRRVGPGETWVVRQSTHLKKLLIAEGGRLEAPPGRTLTLAVNGVGTPLLPGTYSGDVALNVPLELRLRDPGLEGERPRAALYVYSGLYLPEKSAAALLVGGRVGNGGASGFSVASTEPDLTGAVFAGDARYALSGARIEVAGTGLLVAGSADVVVGGNSRIDSGGTALRLAGQGSVLLDGAEVHAGNGRLAEFLPAARATLRIRAARVQGNVDYAPEGTPQAAVALEGALLVGAIQPRAAAANPAMGAAGAPAAGAPVAGGAPSLALDGASRWVVTGNSRLSALTLAPGAVIAAPEGSALTVYVDGEPATLAPGKYPGQVELRVGPAEPSPVAGGAPVETLPAAAIAPPGAGASPPAEAR
jgi:hypothetical protein